MKTKKTNLVDPLPENYKEILESEFCRQGLKLNIALIKDQIHQGKKFAFRSSLVMLDVFGKLNEDYIIEEGKKIIWQRKSDLSKQIQLLITRMCVNAIDLTIAHNKSAK